MSYMGSYSRMTGDPGFFDTLGKIGRSAIGAGVGFLTGGAAGAIRGGISPFVRPSQMPVSRIAPGRGPLDDQIGRNFQGVPLLRHGGSAPPTVGTTGACPPGYHPAKVYVRGQGYQRVGHCVKKRKRNPYNRRAATRAASRLRSLGTGMKSIKKSVNKAARELK